MILLHGLFSDANINWIKFGHAARIAAAGLPGDHARPARPRAQRQAARPEHYPKGILARDLRELVAHLGLDRVRPRRLLARRTNDGRGGGRGAAAAPRDPRRRGARGLRNWKRRKTFFVEAIELFDTVQRGDPHWLSIQFMKSQKVDRVAARAAARQLRGCVHGLARGLHHADAGRLRRRGRRQRLGGGACQRAAQCRLRGSAGHAHELRSPSRSSARRSPVPGR